MIEANSCMLSLTHAKFTSKWERGPYRVYGYRRWHNRGSSTLDDRHTFELIHLSVRNWSAPALSSGASKGQLLVQNIVGQ